MANFWQTLKRIAGNLGTGRLLSRLPRSLRTLARTGEALSRTQQSPAQRQGAGRLPMPRGWAPTPPGPTLEPPVTAEIVQPEQRELSALARFPTPRTEEAAEDFLDRVADAISTVDPSRLTPAQRQAIQRVEQIQRDYRRAKEAAEREAAVEGDDEEGQMIQTLGRGPMGYEQVATEALIGRAIRTPGSSNVYSFVYMAAEQDGGEGTLFSPQEEARRLTWERQYAAGTWRGPYRRSRHGTEMGGILYVTFKLWHPGMPSGERPNEPGPTYAYYDVPMAKFKEFKDAISPGGKGAGVAVWDYLRIRGTRYGHQHTYRLASGAYVPGGGKLVQKGGVYIPRKATVKGFVKRALPSQGVGRRQATRSQLAPSAYKTQRPRIGRR